MSAPNLPSTKRCAVYTRKSTTSGLEKEFTSLDAQREACELFVKSQAHAGWDLVPERYDDGGFTGANFDRPAFKRLVRDIEAGMVDVVVCYKIDRVSRSLLDFAKFMDQLNSHEVGLVSVTQNFSTTDAMGRLTLNMLMSFAEFEREMIAERTRDKIAMARRKGKWTGGKVPLGYNLVDGKLQVDDHEAIIVREIFDLYLDTRSFVQTIEVLNQRCRSARHWTKDAILRVVRSPVYAGLIHSQGTLYPAEHEAIITKDKFDTVQKTIETTSSSPAGGRHNAAYILRGLLRCGTCGSTMIPASARNGSREYRYYRCMKRDKEGKSGCSGAQIPAGAIEQVVVRKVSECSRDPEISQMVEQTVVRRAAEALDKRRQERKALIAKIADLSSKARRLTDELEASEGRTKDVLRQQLDERSAKLADLQADLGELERDLFALEQACATATWIKATLSDFDHLWDLLTPQNRGRILQALVDRVQVDGDEVSVNLALDLSTDVLEEACA